MGCALATNIFMTRAWQKGQKIFEPPCIYNYLNSNNWVPFIWMNPVLYVPCTSYAFLEYFTITALKFMSKKIKSLIRHE